MFCGSWGRRDRERGAARECGLLLPRCLTPAVTLPPSLSPLSTHARHGSGEVCVRGPILFRGYYKDEAQTAEVLDAGGWLHTGDVGTWLPAGRLKIIDRKKNIFKMAQGAFAVCACGRPREGVGVGWGGGLRSPPLAPPARL